MYEMDVMVINDESDVGSSTNSTVTVVSTSNAKLNQTCQSVPKLR